MAHVQQKDHTVLPATHMNHTCLYSPAARHHCPTHCTYPQRDGQAKLTWVAGYIEHNFSDRQQDSTVAV